MFDPMPDSLTFTGSHTVNANSVCAPNTCPVAAVSATPTSGNAPLNVNFNGTGSSDPDAGDTIASYTFNFGDGSGAVTCPADPSCTGTGTTSHTYTAPGDYNATLRVTDSHGLISCNTAGEVITVTQSGVLTNYSLTSNGGVATGSTVYASRSYPPEAAINGDRTGGGWEAGTGGWNDNTRNVWEDWLQVAFGGQPKTVSEIRVFTIQNDFRNPVEPDANTPADVYGILDFDLQYWNGTDWLTVPGGTVTGNNKAMRVVTFTPVTTTRVRVLVHNGRVYFSRIVELEAFGAAGQP
jgi:PKD repeat protein